MEEPKPSRSAAPEQKPVPAREHVTSRTAPVVPEVVTENHSTVTDPVTEDKKDNVVSLRSSPPSVTRQKETAPLNRKYLQHCKKSAAEPSWILPPSLLQPARWGC
jgi:hypothetical protein